MKTRLRVFFDNRDTPLYIADSSTDAERMFIVDPLLRVIQTMKVVNMPTFAERINNYEVFYTGKLHVVLHPHAPNLTQTMQFTTNINNKEWSHVCSRTRFGNSYEYSWNGEFTIGRPKRLHSTYYMLPRRVRRELRLAHRALLEALVYDIVKQISVTMVDLWRHDISWYSDRTPKPKAQSSTIAPV